MTEPEKSPEDFLDHLGDDLSRRILLLASNEAMSAEALADQLNVSRPTVYRRLNTLSDYELLRESLVTDSDGHHYRVFETVPIEIVLEVADGEFRITVRRTDDSTDRLDSFMDGLGTSYERVSDAANERSEETPSRGDSHYG